MNKNVRDACESEFKRKLSKVRVEVTQLTVAVKGK